MLWSVEASVKLNERGRYLLIIHSAPLKMIVEVLSSTLVLNNDILCPIENALYAINNQPMNKLKVVYAIEYSAKKWKSIINVLDWPPESPDSWHHLS
ncbi:hypothetical protein [Citrobacter freundii]|uniref:hypothetical protein n=1 Tax=Citrobacter freundii TaxID=546 RepID=UPI001EEF92CC|nr:hypothetical protein [Citrobacter freundii]